MKKVLLLIIVLFSAALIINAQAPQGFNYQGVARDSQGNPLSETSISVRIGILKGSTLLWQEEQTVETNATGLFSLIIGDESASKTGGTATAFETIDWASGNFSLKISLKTGTSFVSMGTSPIMSVPYALYAEKGPAEEDGSVTNELQNLTYSNGLLSLSMDPTAVEIDLAHIIDTTQAWSLEGDTIYTNSSVSIGTATPNQSLLAVQSSDPQVEKALFEVRNDAGVPVFAVYNDGVIVYVDESKKGVKGGFAVGGYNSATKGLSQEFLRITPDSVRIWVPEGVPAKGVKGGFAVGGYNSATKAVSGNLLEVSSSSTNIYFDTTGQAKGVKGGFAVGGYNSAVKAASYNLLSVTPDSTRVYVNNRPAKGVKGGFAVGGYNSATKGEDGSFMSLQRDNYFIGHNSGSYVTTGVFNSVLGYESGVNITSGESNAFIGYQSGFLNTEGSGNLFFGYQTGYNNLIGNYNTFLGYKAGHMNTLGVNNTFLGSFSGQNNISGDFNTFVGDSTGFSNTEGISNTFLGTTSGLHNTSGYSNVFVGDQAGYMNETGFVNVFIGHRSGRSNVLAGGNVYIGTDAGLNSKGWNNIFIGTHVGQENVTGEGNLFIGYEAGMFNQGGTRNVFIGNWAGRQEQGSGKLYINTNDADSTGSLVWGDFLANKLRFNASVGIGIHPEYDQLSLYSHYGKGVLSLYGAGDGYDYSAIYLKADTTNDNSSYSISQSVDSVFFIGYINNSIYNPRFVARKDGNISLNAYPSEASLLLQDDDDDADVVIKGTGDGQNFSGLTLGSMIGAENYSLNFAANNDFNLSYYDGANYIPRFSIDQYGNVGFNTVPAGVTMKILDSIGSSELVLSGTGDEFDYASITLTSAGATPDSSYKIYHTRSHVFGILFNDGATGVAPRLTISDTGNVGIGLWDGASEALDVNGNARFRTIGSAASANDLGITADGTLTTIASDARLKSNIKPLINSLEKVMQLEGVTYNWKEDEQGKKDVGLIAQDVAEVYPEAVFINEQDGYYGINYSRFPALFVEAFKEQQNIIDNQKDEIDDLKERLERLESLILEK